MTSVLLVICGLFLCLLGATCLKLRRSYLQAFPLVDGQPAIAKSPHFYQPMERLLSGQEFHFAVSRSGIVGKEIRKMRAERRRIFRHYLHSLASDFSAISQQIRALILHSDRPRPDLASQLFRAQALFFFGIAILECRLLVHACGFGTIRVSAAALVASLKHLQEELSRLSPVPEPQTVLG